ncbi:MAG: flagellar biosynthesis protein FlgA [Clostridia bacterium]|nr:flagellar biosynthesis protein FlgA [Clostridia bacterium]
MKVNSIKEIRPGSQFPKKLFAILISIAVILGSFFFLNNASKAAQDTVEVVRIKSSDGIPAKTVITKEDLEMYSLIRKEFKEDMVTNLEDAVNKYSLYFLRGKTILYKDQFSAEKPLKNEWMYFLEKSGEVLTIPYNYLECAGDILTPGDNVKIRVAYDETTTESRDADPSSPGYGREKTVRKVDTLFESITVKDLLNSKGHSIYEVYKEVLKLNESKRQEVMKSSDFLDSILPKSLVLEGSTAQVDNYAKYKNKKEISFTITLLSRKDNKNIMDQLPTVAKEIESWISEKK